MILGCATGTMRSASVDVVSPEHVARIRSIGCNAVELSCNNVERLDRLVSIQPSDLEGFEYVSLHAPALKFVYNNNPLTKATLKVLEEAHRRLKFCCVVFHPDRIEDWGVLKKADLPWAIENMDNRKTVGRGVQELEALFADHDYPMVLDLNHCFTHDPSMALAHELYDRFRGRIVEIQVSGYETLHDPLSRTQQWKILKAVPDKGLPIIIESQVKNEDELKMEYECVKGHLTLASS